MNPLERLDYEDRHERTQELEKRDTLSLLRRLRSPLLRFVGAAASCALLVGISGRFIDRPVATWVHQHLGDARFAWFTGHYQGHPLPIGPFSFMAAPAQALGPLALLVLVGLAVVATTGWRPQMRGRILLVLSLSVFVAMEINKELKLVFGRTWPESWLGDNPSWIRDGAFGFHPFHGGGGWGSFPSGHSTVTLAPITVLWLVWPELRLLWVALTAVVITGLIGANYHFVSDIIGGIYLGVAVGLGAARLMLLPRDRLDRPIFGRRSSQADLDRI